MISSEIRTLTTVASSALIRKSEIGKQLTSYISEQLTELGFERIDQNGSHDTIDGSTAYFAINEYWKLHESTDDYCLGFSVYANTTGSIVRLRAAILLIDSMKTDLQASSQGNANGAIIQSGEAMDYSFPELTNTNLVYTLTVCLTKFENDFAKMISFGRTPSLEKSFGLMKVKDEFLLTIFGMYLENDWYGFAFLKDNAINYSGYTLFKSKEVMDLSDEILMAPTFIFGDRSLTEIHSSLKLDGVFECPANIVTTNSKYSINGEMYYALSGQLLVKI